MAKESNFVSAVVYVHNNEDCIENILGKLNSELENNFLHYEIILVNDASTDNSVAKIKHIIQANSNSMVQIVNLSYFHGVEMAMNAGVDLAIGDFVYEIDTCDVDYDSDLWLKVYHKSLEGFDIVSAAPENGSSVGSSIFYNLMNNFSNNKHALKTERFRILSRRAINRIHAMNLNIPYRKSLYVNCGLEQTSIIYSPNKVHGTLGGDKELENYRWNTAVDVLILFSNIGYRFTFGMSCLMLMLSVVLGLYALSYFAVGEPVSGWTSIVCVLSIGFAGIFAVTTIMIKYLDIIINLIFKRQNYVIKGIEKIVC